MHSFVGRRSTTAETTAAEQQHILESQRTSFSHIRTHVTSLRVLYNIHHVNQRSKLNTYIAEVPVLHTPVEVILSMTCRFLYIWARQTRECTYMSVAFPDVIVFDGFIRCVVYSRGNRTPESEKKKQTTVYLIKRKMKNNILYT